MKPTMTTKETPKPQRLRDPPQEKLEGEIERGGEGEKQREKKVARRPPKSHQMTVVATGQQKSTPWMPQV